MNWTLDPLRKLALDDGTVTVMVRFLSLSLGHDRRGAYPWHSRPDRTHLWHIGRPRSHLIFRATNHQRLTCHPRPGMHTRKRPTFARPAALLLMCHTGGHLQSPSREGLDRGGITVLGASRSGFSNPGLETEDARAKLLELGLGGRRFIIGKAAPGTIARPTRCNFLRVLEIRHLSSGDRKGAADRPHSADFDGQGQMRQSSCHWGHAGHGCCSF